MKKIVLFFFAVLLLSPACQPVAVEQPGISDVDTDLINNSPIDFSMVGYRYGAQSVR